MEFSSLHISNYRALKDVRIPLSRFGCLIGENNAGKSSFLQALSLFFSGTKLAPDAFFDPSEPIRIAITFDNIGEADLARLAAEHQGKVAGIIEKSRLTLARVYGADGKSALRYCVLTPTDARFSDDNIADLVKSQKAGQAFVDKIVTVFPELSGIAGISMNQEAMKNAIQGLANSLPDDKKTITERALPTGIDKSIIPMLPDPIYIPAVKDLADDIKTAESAPFGKILAILLQSIETKLPDAQNLFQLLNSQLNRVEQPGGIFIDQRLDEVKLIEATLEKHLRESFANVAIRIAIPPPELKAILSSTRIYANDGVDGPIDSKGDGLRRALVFSILRSYVQLKEKLSESLPAAARPSYLLLFEEPELFLHPQAQHALFSALRVFSQEHHVMVTTHSPMFFGSGATGTFIKVRKVSDASVAGKPFTKAQPIDLSDINAKDQFQMICFENNNSAFFADTVVLVEGDSDFVLMPHIARTLDPSWDIAQAPIHFARITGKGNIRRYRDFFNRFAVRVPVIADLDLIVNGFDHILPDEALKKARAELLARADSLIAISDGTGESSSAKHAKSAHESGELKGLWRQAKVASAAFAAGSGTFDDLAETIDAFFAWQRKSDRVAVLRESSDKQLLALKWKLLHMLRNVDVYVLERGAIEQYYPDVVKGPDKPSQAQAFCTMLSTKSAILECCGMQEFEQGGKPRKVNEFELIFGGIYANNRTVQVVED